MGVKWPGHPLHPLGTITVDPTPTLLETQRAPGNTTTTMDI